MTTTLRDQARRALFRVKYFRKEAFECSVCGYHGPFVDVNRTTGYRKHAGCLKCGALERHRLQYLVVANVLDGRTTASLKMLHFAPEPFFTSYFSGKFRTYETADLDMPGVNHHVDLQDLPFADQSYDFVFASHVLEHVPDDHAAITEIRRILKPGGIAILPVPMVAEKTIEYPEANPHEFYHVRAPGFDYYERYRRHFSRVEEYGSDSFPEKHQLFEYEDRTQWPTPECPLRPAMAGEKHRDVVPVCYVSS